MSGGILAQEAPFVGVLLEGVQDGETEGLLTAAEVAEAALDAESDITLLSYPLGREYRVLGRGDGEVTEVILVREPEGWGIASVERVEAFGPVGLLPLRGFEDEIF